MNHLDLAIPEGICDAHVHFGYESLSRREIGVGDLKALRQRGLHDLILAFPGDHQPLQTSLRLLKAASRLQWLHCLFRLSLSDYQELEGDVAKYLSNNRVLGLKIHVSQDQKRISDPVYSYALEAVEARRGIVLVHCGRWVQTAHVKFLFEIAPSYPGIHFVGAHMGGNEPELTRFAADHVGDIRNVQLDTSNCRTPFLIAEAVRKAGPERFLFGSDIPFGSLLGNIGTIIDAGLNPEELSLIFRENLRNLIRIAARV